VAYGPEAHTGHLAYEAVVEHTPTGNRLFVTVDPFREDGTTPSEAVRDSLFQAFITRLEGMSDVTVISATKTGNFSASVTP
jgi:hypothetical protein